MESEAFLSEHENGQAVAEKADDYDRDGGEYVDYFGVDEEMARLYLLDAIYGRHWAGRAW